MFDENSPLLPHGDLKLLRDFAATEEFVLEPGDMLYVPPGCRTTASLWATIA